jgi:LysM repeat protein
MRKTASIGAMVSAGIVLAVNTASTHALSMNTNITKPKAKIVLADAPQTTPAGNPGKYVTVQPGDYLSKIALENGSTYLRMYAANQKIENPDLIYTGDSRLLPLQQTTLQVRQYGTVLQHVNQAVTGPSIPETATTEAFSSPNRLGPVLADCNMHPVPTSRLATSKLLLLQNFL